MTESIPNFYPNIYPKVSNMIDSISSFYPHIYPTFLMKIYPTFYVVNPFSAALPNTYPKFYAVLYKIYPTFYIVYPTFIRHLPDVG